MYNLHQSKNNDEVSFIPCVLHWYVDTTLVALCCLATAPYWPMDHQDLPVTDDVPEHKNTNKRIKNQNKIKLFSIGWKEMNFWSLKFDHLKTVLKFICIGEGVKTGITPSIKNNLKYVSSKNLQVNHFESNLVLRF